MTEIIQIQNHNRKLIQDFLSSAGNALTKFRYFDSRPLSILDQHLATFVLVQEAKVIGYGHLDQEAVSYTHLTLPTTPYV